MQELRLNLKSEWIYYIQPIEISQLLNNSVSILLRRIIEFNAAQPYCVDMVYFPELIDDLADAV